MDYSPTSNAFAVTKRPDKPADMHVDLYCEDVSKIEAKALRLFYVQVTRAF